MAKFGLPTYPIADGMLIGNREPDELEWLLEHGVIQNDIIRYAKISKISESEYQLVAVYERLGEEDIILISTSLHALIVAKKIEIAYWHWYSKHE